MPIGNNRRQYQMRNPRRHEPAVQRQSHHVFRLQAEPEKRGGKNKITKNGSSASIIVVKLLRTDTTLDLSQKARVVKNHGHWRCLIYGGHRARTKDV